MWTLRMILKVLEEMRYLTSLQKSDTLVYHKRYTGVSALNKDDKTMTNADGRTVVGAPTPTSQKEWVMPHAVKTENPTNYAARTKRAMYRPGEYGNTSIFTYHGDDKDMPTIVGEEAVSTSTGDKLTGNAKYKKGYLDRLTLGAFLKLFPDGHDNIILACAHTTNAVPYVEAIADAVRGKKKITTVDGREITYNVRALVPFDEPAGGLLRFKNSAQGQYNSGDMMAGERLAVVDIGGKVSSIYPVEVLSGNRYQIYWEKGRSFDLGIQDVDYQLQQELVALHPETFDVRSIPLSIRQQVLRTGGTAKVRTAVMKFEQAYLNATAPILDLLAAFWQNEMQNALDVNHILATGGGSGVLYKALSEGLFTEYHAAGAMYLADRAEIINLANLRGGEEAAKAWFADHMDKFKKGKMLPVVVIFDPGNSDLKFKILGAGYNVS
jgi:hypothetical protein